MQFSKLSVGDKSSQILSAEWPSGNLLWSPHFFSISTQSDLEINKETEFHDDYLNKGLIWKRFISMLFPSLNPQLSQYASQQSVYIYTYMLISCRREEQICDTKTETIACTTPLWLWAWWSLFSMASYACVFQAQAFPSFANV